MTPYMFTILKDKTLRFTFFAKQNELSFKAIMNREESEKIKSCIRDLLDCDSRFQVPNKIFKKYIYMCHALSGLDKNSTVQEIIKTIKDINKNGANKEFFEELYY